MKLILEEINPDPNSSFRLWHNPKLSDLFFWHFHPEVELVFIDGVNGRRHIGDHTASFFESDLALIGSYIPHLNFDYGVRGHYEKDVLHISSKFRSHHLKNIPELQPIRDLLDRSQRAIIFGSKTKEKVGSRIKNLHRKSPFDQLVEVLQLLQILAHTDDLQYLHDSPYINRYSKKQQERLRNVYVYIEENYMHRIDLDTVAELNHLTKSSFCRFFKKATQRSFVDFLNHYRVSQSKNMLIQGNTISQACYSCGFESLSYFNRVFKKLTGENPSSFRKKHHFVDKE